MINIYIHGSCSPNPGKGAYGFIILSEGEKIKSSKGIVSQYTTTNVAEYNAIIKALEIAMKFGFETVKILSSNKLVVKQVKGISKVNINQLKTLYNKVIKLSKEYFKIVELQYVPRKENKAIELARSLLETEPTSRKERAEQLIKNAFIKTGEGYIYLKDNGYYEINLEKLTCTCYDNQVNGYVCKHILAAQMIDEKITALV